MVNVSNMIILKKAHDLLGGLVWCYYGDDGNTKRGKNHLQGVVTGAAIPVAAPFAVSDLLSPDVFGLLFKMAGK